MRQRLFSFCFVVSVLASAFPVKADSVVVPNEYANIDGPTSLGGFLNFRAQHVYAASQFPQAVMEITSVAFRLDANVPTPFPPSTRPDLLARMSTTAKSPDALSVSYAENIGSDEVVVFDGDWTRGAVQPALPNGTYPFEIILTFTTPFRYNPEEGNLLFDWESPNNFGMFGSSGAADAAAVLGDSISTMSGPYGAATGAPLGSSFGLVTQFNYQVVPEPSLVISIASVVLVLTTRCRHVTRF